MISDEMLKELNEVIDGGFTFGPYHEEMVAMIEERKQLVAIAKWAGHLQADMIDEPATHYNSWFGLEKSLKDWKGEG